MQQRSAIGTILKCVVFLLCLEASHGLADAPEVITISSSRRFAADDSASPSVSADGKVVAYESIANNLVPGDLRSTRHVYVYEKESDVTTRVSVSSDGVVGNGDSSSPQLSADGQYVVFTSRASNLVESDTNEVSDVFIHNRSTGVTTLVSVGLEGVSANAASENAVVTDDGAFVVFESAATNLVVGDANQVRDIFIATINGGGVALLSKSSEGVQGDLGSREPDVSADGRYVVFASDATNLVANDVNQVRDVFLVDRQEGKTLRVSVDSNGNQVSRNSTHPTVSNSGLLVAFESAAPDLVDNDTNEKRDVFLRDRVNRKTIRIAGASEGSGDSQSPQISDNGRYVAFHSEASNLIEGDTNEVADCFVYTVSSSSIDRVSVNMFGKGGVRESLEPAISARGELVVFQSTSTFLLPILNPVAHIFTSVFNECEDDSGKRAPGTCGCGVDETDSNGNEIPDCLDPSRDLVPLPVVVSVSGSRVRVNGLQSFDIPVRYKLIFSRKNERNRFQKERVFVGSGTTLDKSDFSDGRWRVRYRVLVGSGEEKTKTRFSPTVGFAVGNVGTTNTKKKKKRRKKKTK